MKKNLLLAAAAALLLTGTPAFAGKGDDTLNVAFNAETETLDHYKIAGREGLIIAMHLNEGLLYKDPETNQFKPALASAYRFVDDKTLEFELRRGVKFHDGSVLTADDVVHTLTTVAGKDYGTRYRISVDWIGEVTKVDDHKVRITIAQPTALALEMLAMALPIYPKAYFAQVGSQGMATKPIGAGPYKLVDLTPGTRWVLERFDDYFADSPRGKPAIKRISIRAIKELNTRIAEQMTGRVDWMRDFPLDTAQRLASVPAVEIQNSSILRVGFLQFDAAAKAKKTPVTDPRVRRAFAQAIDREALVKAFVGGSSQVVHTACNPAQVGCVQTGVRKYAHDPAAGRALLAEAGFPNGFEIEMIYSGVARAIAEAVAGDLAKIGVKLTLTELQYAAAATRWRAGDAPLVLSTWGSYGIGDTAAFTSNYFGLGADDLAQDAEVAGWLKIADTSNDAKLREENYGKALAKIADQGYWLPLYSFNMGYAVSRQLNFKPHADEYARWFLSSWK